MTPGEKMDGCEEPMDVTDAPPFGRVGSPLVPPVALADTWKEDSKKWGKWGKISIQGGVKLPGVRRVLPPCCPNWR